VRWLSGWRVGFWICKSQVQIPAVTPTSLVIIICSLRLLRSVGYFQLLTNRYSESYNIICLGGKSKQMDNFVPGGLVKKSDSRG